jgi:hypothetical protein
VGPLGLGGCGIFLGYPDYRVVFMTLSGSIAGSTGFSLRELVIYQ